jgi:hypothetical protein
MKCISVCFKWIGSGRVYRLTDRPTTSDLIMLDRDILDPCFVPLHDVPSVKSQTQGFAMTFLSRALIVVSVFMTSPAFAESVKVPEWLYIHTAETAKMASDNTILIGTNRDIFAFTDRPNRLYRYFNPTDYVALWDADSENGFLDNPPNSMVTWMIGEATQQVEANIVNVEVTDDGNGILYELKLKAGTQIPIKLSHVSVFVGGVCGGNGMGGGKQAGVLMRCK